MVISCIILLRPIYGAFSDRQMVFEFIFSALGNSRLLNRQTVGVAFDDREQRCATVPARPALPDGGGGLAGDCDLVGAGADGVGDEETGEG